MKANELMIGDWVFMDGIPHQLSDINLIAVWLSDEKRLNTMDFKPIQLTEEILKANGFEYQEVFPIDQYNGIYYTLRGKNICINIVGEELDVIGMIKTVHELQHALRLCGLNELADNFKLKEE